MPLFQHVFFLKRHKTLRIDIFFHRLIYFYIHINVYKQAHNRSHTRGCILHADTNISHIDLFRRVIVHIKSVLIKKNYSESHFRRLDGKVVFFWLVHFASLVGLVLAAAKKNESNLNLRSETQLIVLPNGMSLTSNTLALPSLIF